VRLLRPDGSVADQYSFEKAEADLSFCRVADGWNTCKPTPGAPNQATSQSEPESVTAAPEQYTVALSGPDTAAADTPQPVAGVPMLFAMQSDRVGGAPAYAYPTAGALYRGVSRATPVPSASPAPTPAKPRAALAPAAEHPTTSLGLGAGLFLCVTGGAIAGYDRLRSRRAPQPPAPAAPDDFDEEIDELSEDTDD
jgi:hypothetical protein